MTIESKPTGSGGAAMPPPPPDIHNDELHRQIAETPPSRAPTTKPVTAPPRRPAKSALSQLLGRPERTWWKRFYSLLLSGAAVGAVLIFSSLVIQDVVTKSTEIEPIATPKSLADRGFTPDVVARALRDSLNEYAQSVQTSMKPPEIALHGEFAEIVVPSVGLPVGVVSAKIRRLFDIETHRTISGEISETDGLLSLCIRLDGQPIFQSPRPLQSKEIKTLLTSATAKIFWEIGPYFVAAYESERDHDQALELIERITVERPLSDDNVRYAYALRAVILEDSGQLKEAEKWYQKSIALNPGTARLHSNFGSFLDQRERTNEAEAEYRKAIKLDPSDASTHLELGNLLSGRHQNTEAANELRKALAIKPHSAVAHWSLGDLLSRMEQDGAAQVEYFKAERDFRELTTKATTANIYVSFGNYLSARGNRQEAEVQYRKALDLSPNSASAHANLGLVFEQAHESGKATLEYRKAIALSPNYALPRIRLSLSSAIGEEEAETEARKAIALEPRQSSPHDGLGAVLRRQGKAQEAVVEYRRAIELNDYDAIAHYGLGLALVDIGDDAAQTEFGRAIALNQHSPEMHIGIGVALNKQGKTAAAEVEYRKAIELDPKNSLAHVKLGLLLLVKRGKTEEADVEYLSAADPPSHTMESYEKQRLGDILKVVKSVQETSKSEKKVKLSPPMAKTK